jgi:hypothetical protein
MPTKSRLKISKTNLTIIKRGRKGSIPSRVTFTSNSRALIYKKISKMANQTQQNYVFISRNKDCVSVKEVKQGTETLVC